MIEVYTDGGIKGGYMGAGVLVVDRSGFVPKVECFICASGTAPGTSPRAELLGAATGLRIVEHVTSPVELVCDAEYVVHGLDRLEGMLRTNFRPGGVPMINADMWEEVAYGATMLRGSLSARWVKGHAGYAPNEVVDRLAKVGALFASAGLSGVFRYKTRHEGAVSLLLTELKHQIRGRNKWVAAYRDEGALPEHIVFRSKLPMRQRLDGYRT
jgi:ribonuclease HI